jgi:MFS family permease
MDKPPANRRIIPGLMVPFFSVIFHLSTFVVAVPAIRGEFSLAADTTSWLVLVFTIPYVLFMPFYGRMADRFGPRSLMRIGVTIFSAGTLLCVFAPSMEIIIAGRFVQATGAASVNPLSISIISRYFPLESRARALGTWNAAGPFTGTLGPLVGGLLIDSFGWRSIFVPVLAVALIAIPVLGYSLPKEKSKSRSEKVERFDWPGMMLTAAVLTCFIFYLSSRPITERNPFTDWRILIALFVSATFWFLWERSRSVPFVAISLFAKGQFAVASVCVSFRMFYLGTISFLIPLFASEILDIPAAKSGLIIALHAFALLFTLRLGGHIADTVSLRKPIIYGMFGQGAILLWLAALPGTSFFGLLIPVVLHGALAGFSLAPLHHLAMLEVPQSESGAGAGTYSMSRFFGSALGASFMGVVLEFFLSSRGQSVSAYKYSFLIAAIVGLLGTLPTLLIRETSKAQ